MYKDFLYKEYIWIESFTAGGLCHKCNNTFDINYIFFKENNVYDIRNVCSKCFEPYGSCQIISEAEINEIYKSNRHVSLIKDLGDLINRYGIKGVQEVLTEIIIKDIIE